MRVEHFIAISYWVSTDLISFHQCKFRVTRVRRTALDFGICTTLKDKHWKLKQNTDRTTQPSLSNQLKHNNLKKQTSTKYITVLELCYMFLDENCWFTNNNSGLGMVFHMSPISDLGHYLQHQCNDPDYFLTGNILSAKYNQLQIIMLLNFLWPQNWLMRALIQDCIHAVRWWDQFHLCRASLSCTVDIWHSQRYISS